MKASIEASRCQGHNRCLMVDATVFDSDDMGFAFVIGDGTVPAAEEGAVRLAAANCPERAIEITEPS